MNELDMEAEYARAYLECEANPLTTREHEQRALARQQTSKPKRDSRGRVIQPDAAAMPLTDRPSATRVGVWGL